MPPGTCSAAMTLFGRFIRMMKAGICAARLFDFIFRFMSQINCLGCLDQAEKNESSIKVMFTGCFFCCKPHWRCQVSGVGSWGYIVYLIAEIQCTAAPDHLVSPVYPEAGSADHPEVFLFKKGSAVIA